MKKRLLVALCIGLISPTAIAGASAPKAELTPEQRETLQHLEALAKSLHPQFGDVSIDTAHAVLHLGKNYYFLDAPSAKRVLTEAWGNPPDAVSNVLGMVFPAGSSFASDGWGAVVTYSPSGYVSDKDAQSADYAQLLKDAQAGDEEANEERVRQGFAPTHLVGWAQTPSYDPAHHAVIWARDIRFGDQKPDTLNYDVRLLNRGGVLSLNMVSTMDRLVETRQAAALFGNAASFEKGFRYEDFNPDMDKEAGYGIAGLVAAGVGVAAAKKLGFLAVALLWGKKLIVFVLAGAAALAGRIRRLFRRGDAE